MLPTLATLKAVKKNAEFAPSSIIHKGVALRCLPHLSDSNFLGKPKYLAFFCISLLYLVSSQKYILIK